jgi:dipeptidyl aminopeptidase/acylaminoacyl peptidase
MSNMKVSFVALLTFALLGCTKVNAIDVSAAPEIVYFQSQGLTLGGELFKPPGNGPFPAILYNHGSAPGMLNSQASKVIGPLFTNKGWIFFMPYRRGQGLSAEAGPYIGDEIAAARRRGGVSQGAAIMTKLLSTDHLQDQLAALQWLRSQSFVQSSRVAVVGNSFGGIESVLGAAKESYCATVDASGAAETWKEAPGLQQLMKEAVRASKSPIFFYQAQNDFDLTPSRVLYAEMKEAGRKAEIKIYPPFGTSHEEGHSFAYLGSTTWFPDVFNFVESHCADSSR